MRIRVVGSRASETGMMGFGKWHDGFWSRPPAFSGQKGNGNHAAMRRRGMLPAGSRALPLVVDR